METIPIRRFASHSARSSLYVGIKNLPQQRANELHIQAAHKFVASARGAMYPTFSIFGVLGTNYFNKSTQNISSFTVNPAIGKVNLNNTDYLVYPIQPITQYNTEYIPYFLR